MFFMYQKFIECGVLKHTDECLETYSLIGIFSSINKAIAYATNSVELANSSYGERYPREDIDSLFGDLTVMVDEGVILLSCKAMQFVICEFVVDKPTEIPVEYRWHKEE